VPQECFNFGTPNFPLRTIFGVGALDGSLQTQHQITRLDCNCHQAERFTPLPLDGIPQGCGSRKALRYDQAYPRPALGSIPRAKVKIKTLPPHYPSSRHYD
jgi:hypothetical protein